MQNKMYRENLVACGIAGGVAGGLSRETTTQLPPLPQNWPNLLADAVVFCYALNKLNSLFTENHLLCFKRLACSYVKRVGTVLEFASLVLQVRKNIQREKALLGCWLFGWLLGAMGQSHIHRNTLHMEGGVPPRIDKKIQN